MKKILLCILLGLCIAFPATNSKGATSLWFDPLNQLYGAGDMLNLDLWADIDEADAIFGFGFDLSFDNGATYISGPGDSGLYLTFVSFTPNSTYFNLAPPLWDDGDTISGEVPFLEPDVWGNDILLGSFQFVAPDSGPFGRESFYLGPPEGDYGSLGEEGLLGDTALMPPNPEAEANAIPLPAAVLLLGSGLIGFLVYQRRR